MESFESTISQLRLCYSLLEKCHSEKRTGQIYYRLFQSQLDSIIRRSIVQKFSSYLEDRKNFPEAVNFLKHSCDNINASFKAIKYQKFRQTFFEALKVQILSQRPHYLTEYLETTYTRAFKAYLNLEKSKSRATEDDMEVEETLDESNDLIDADESGDGHGRCSGCADKSDNCQCQSIYNDFCSMNDHLRELDLLEGLVDDTVMNISKTMITRRVSVKGKTYSNSYLDELVTWVHSIVKRWVSVIYGLTDEKSMETLGQKLVQCLENAYADVRVLHMFEIIIEYPNSEAAIQDIKLCLERAPSPSFRLNLIESVKQSLIESLLHPGVSTYDILTAYISAIKALRALDPTGLILQLVTKPVRQYLKSRDDTVRCIVTALTDEDNNSELNREMIKTGSQTNENNVDGRGGPVEITLPCEGEKCTSANFESWKPDPIKLNSADDLVKSSRFSDIVSILVNIYETKDLFVVEYQKLLSQRLLNKYEECNLDTEVRNLELLTLRFSDCEIHRCEVMLKDVQSSKRINKRILSGDIREHRLERFRDIDVLIVSSPFWPEKFGPMASLSEEPPEIEFPPDIEHAITTYTKAFEAIQASRTLHWRHHLGSVNMDLTINGKTQNFTVSPVHAAILYLFKEKQSWRLNEMMLKTSLPAATLRSRLALWLRNGLIRETSEDKYDLILE